MRDTIRRICELQPRYSAENTSEMQERGILVRDTLRAAIHGLQPALSASLGAFGADFDVDASDGIGRKTELPWIRFYSRSMSPKPTEGFYCVTHFSTDGSAAHITLGCGSSRFHNGSSVPLPNSELDAQTSWARRVVVEEFGTAAPFDDEPDFGARRPLPISFQRATTISKRIPFGDITVADFNGLYALAAERLRSIYAAQVAGRDLSAADLSELEIAATLKPRKASGYRQGYGLPAAARRAVELRAMAVAEAWLSDNGYQVRDLSSSQPFDFVASKLGKDIKVEVKGTTSDRVDAILMTRNEIELHRRELGKTALFIVSSIRLSRDKAGYVATGGMAEVLIGWNVDHWLHKPTSFRLERQLPRSP